MKINRYLIHRFFLYLLIPIITMACASYPSGPREPQPGDDQYDVAEDGFLAVPVEEGILINDKPREGTRNILLTLGPVTTDSGGTIDLAEDGSFTYKPGTDFYGTDRLTYTIENSKGKSSKGVVTFSVTPRPDPPKPVDDRRETSANRPITIDALSNDVEPDGEAMKLMAVGQPISGTAQLSDDGQLIYTPAPNHSGEVAFSYIVSDINGEEATGWVFITIINENSGIEAQPDTMTAVEDAASTIALSVLLENDRDLENGAPLTITELGMAQNGTVVRNGNESLTYTPNPNFFGTDTFTYLVQSQSGNTASATVTVTVTPVADAPTISTISDQTTAEDTPLAAIAFTVGDVETPVEALTVGGTSSNRVLVPDSNINIGGGGANRTLSITPAPNQFGSTRITVAVDDGQGGINTTSFLLTVTPVNDLPVISDIANQVTPEDLSTGPIAFTISDPDRPAAELELSGASTNQALVPNGNIRFGGSGANRTVTIVPAVNQSGTAAITITLIDDAGPNTDTSFLLTVTAVDDPPTVSGINPVQSTPEDTPIRLPFTLIDVDSPINALQVTATSSNVALVPNPSIVIGGTGANRSLTIIPFPNRFGRTNVTLRLEGGQSVGTFTFALVVSPVNDPPTISAIGNQEINWNPITGRPPTPITVSFTIGDLETPVGQLALSYSIAPANGTIVFGGTGANRTATIRPGQQSGNFNVSIVTTDGLGGTATSNFVLIIRVVIPSLSESRAALVTTAGKPAMLPAERVGPGKTDRYTTAEDIPLSIPARTGLLANDTDPMGRSLRVTSTETLSSFYGGEVLINSDGGFHYTPPANFDGQDSFDYQTAPAGTAAATYSAKAVISITAVNDQPLVENDVYAVTPGQPLTIGAAHGVLANDRDVEDQDLQVTAQSNSYLTITPNGGFTYIPAGGFTGRDIFTYEVSDGNRTSTAFISFLVGDEKVPLAQLDGYVLSGESFLNVAADKGLLGNDRSPNGRMLTVLSTGVFDTLFGGEVNIQPDGSFDYSPPPNFNGFDSFIYRITDRRNTVMGSAAISVTP